MQAAGMMEKTTCFGSMGLNTDQTFTLPDGSVPTNIPAAVAGAYSWSDEIVSDEIVQWGAMGECTM